MRCEKRLMSTILLVFRWDRSRNVSDLRCKKILKSTTPLLIFQKDRSRYESPASFDINLGNGPLRLFPPRFNVWSFDGEELFPISRGPLKPSLSRLRWINEGIMKRDDGIDPENEFEPILKYSSLEKLLMLDGSLPSSWLKWRLIVVCSLKLSSTWGKLPLSLLDEGSFPNKLHSRSFKTLKFFKLPIESGRVPARLLELRSRIWRCCNLNRLLFDLKEPLRELPKRFNSTTLPVLGSQLIPSQEQQSVLFLHLCVLTSLVKT